MHTLGAPIVEIHQMGIGNTTRRMMEHWEVCKVCVLASLSEERFQSNRGTLSILEGMP